MQNRMALEHNQAQYRNAGIRVFFFINRLVVWSCVHVFKCSGAYRVDCVVLF